VLQPDGNVGAAAGWNLAMRELLARDVEYVGIWNVDVSPDPLWVERMVRVMEGDQTIGACQPLLLYSDAPDTVQMFGGSLDVRLAQARHDFVGVTNLDQLPALHEADYLDGGTMFVRASVLRRVGSFDERLFLYLEDCDLSVRIRAAGFRLVAVRDARAWHHHREQLGRLPTPAEEFYATRNRFFFARKYGGRHAMLEHAALWLMREPRHVVYFLRRGRGDLVLASVSGAVSGMLGLMGKRGWVE
jgi:GT2 family glycosyltransferase